MKFRCAHVGIEPSVLRSADNEAVIADVIRETADTFWKRTEIGQLTMLPNEGVLDVALYSLVEGVEAVRLWIRNSCVRSSHQRAMVV